jgi:hypothetical protein
VQFFAGLDEKGEIMTRVYPWALLPAPLLLLAACAQFTLPSAPRSPEPEPLAEVDCGTLIMIEAEDMGAGLATQQRWLEQNFPGATVVNQSFDRCGEVPVERVVFLAEGVERVVVFDISSFYGKVEGEDLDSLLDG